MTTINYKGYTAILCGVKTLIVKKGERVVFHTKFRTAETLTQVHELIDEIKGLEDGNNT